MDAANKELAAMQAVANALATLGDGESRNRVLRWAAEHFSNELVPTVLTPQPMQAAPVELQESCDPENLDSLFEDGTPQAGANPPCGAKPSVTATISSFVADFQKLARDWQNA